MTTALVALRQFLCGLREHDALLHFEHGRISLLCTSCGHETPGWDVRDRPTARATRFDKPTGWAIAWQRLRERRVLTAGSWSP